MKLFPNNLSVNEDFLLQGETVDIIASIIDDFLKHLRMDRSSCVRIRLSMEEALLRWMDHFGTNVKVHMDVGTTFNKPTITFLLNGEQYNPLVSSENDLGEWAESLFTGISITPTYNYRKGVNILQLKMNKPERKVLFPEAIMNRIVYTILDPIQNLFLRILNLSSGPIIFLSVITATCAVGSMTAIGKSGRRMAVRFISMTFLITLIAAVLMIKPLSIDLVTQTFDEGQFASVLDLFLQAIPNDALSPIIEGNSPQMILIALIIGNALLAAGQKASRLQSIIEQADSVGLIIAGWVSRLSPFFVAVLLILGIWNGSISVIIGIWYPILMIIVIAGLALIISIFRVSHTHKVPVKALIAKMKPSFLIAFRTSSVDASIAENLVCCERKLGISKKLTSYGVPLGLIAYMPAAGVATIIIVLYAARAYHVGVSVIWLIIAITLTVALTAATPPVSGVGILTYTVLFSQLGIPVQALTMAMVADILIGFAATPLDQGMLQMELVHEAKTLDLLDQSALQR